jgi:glycosyltransferase involved in cell wall biosynthesis
LLDLSLGLLGRPVKSKIVIVLRRGLKDHLRSFDPVKARLKTLLTNPFLKYLHDKKRVLLFADSELITEELVAAGFADAKTLPIPHLPPRQQNQHRQGGIVIGYFGGARYDKGFDILPRLMECVLNKYQNGSLILQSFLFDRSGPVQVAAAKLCALRDAFPDRITLLPKYLSDAEYADYMRKCSIILIPYRREFYGKGTSGVLAEAIACGGWAVVPADTWMASQREKYSRIVTFDSFDTQSLVDAVDFCIKNQINVDTEKVNAEIDKWYSFHSPQNYVNILRSSFR